LGEIDIIARDGDTIVFVEVKARQTGQFGAPKWAVTPRKQRKISMVALYYLKTAGLSQSKARFDVVSIRTTSQRPEVEIIRNAFELLYG
jgi:putative endonuclease